MICEVHVFPLKVTRQSKQWPERNGRLRATIGLASLIRGRPAAASTVVDSVAYGTGARGMAAYAERKQSGRKEGRLCAHWAP
jgi:hypothetical protein